MNTNDMAIMLLTGTGATALTDLWAILRRRLFRIPFPNFGMVGRWMAQMARGHFRPRPIATVPPVPGERAIGWTAHYAIGIGFAFLLPAIWGWQWAHQPTLAPALIVGIATVTAPLFVMQPGMGARPSAPARIQSVITHAVFGLGLYLAGTVIDSLLTGE